MPATQISNPRDLLVQLLGELLFVERRLSDCVLDQLATAAHDDELKEALQQHRDETKQHAERAEEAFRKIAVAPTSNLSPTFESAVAQHNDLGSALKEPRLADVFHAHSALHTEHWEIAAYTTVIALAEAMGHDDTLRSLRDSLKDEERARELLTKTIDRLTRDAGGG